MEVLAIDNVLNNVSNLWVFGYGSILWKTGFQYERKKIGYITGYVRRFWQGSTSHRGTPENPGRVATLIHTEELFMEEDEENGNHNDRVWGAAYELVGKPMIVEALDHLGVRECLLGGYISVMTPFHERPSSSQRSPPELSVLMFTATETNELFLGPADSMDDLAAQIVSCRGPCGHNIQYVLQLSNFMREYIPEEDDPHLFGLVARIEAQCAEQGIDVEELVNEVPHPETSGDQLCEKCKTLCSEYAFCKNCRADTIQDALTCGVTLLAETPDDTIIPEEDTAEEDMVPPELPISRRRYSVSQRRRSSITQQRRSSILQSLPTTSRRRRSSLLELLQDVSVKQRIEAAAASQ